MLLAMMMLFSPSYEPSANNHWKGQGTGLTAIATPQSRDCSLTYPKRKREEKRGQVKIKQLMLSK